MRTTTVVWIIPENPEEKTDEEKAQWQAKSAQLLNKAGEIGGDLYKEELTRTFEPGSRMVVKRAWPDTETAQAWVDHVLSEGASEAQIDPE